MAQPATTPVQDIFSVISRNLLLQYAFIIPILLIFFWIGGAWITWGSILATAIGYSVRFVANRKLKVFTRLMNDQPITYKTNEIQKVAWLNLLVTKFWQNRLDNILRPQLEKVSQIMKEKKPGWMVRLEIGEWSVGKIAPRITQVYAPVELNESLYSMDFEILAIPECRLEIIVQPIKQATLRFKISELKFQGIMRVTFQLNNLFPDASIVSVGFVSDPIIDVAVRPIGALDLISLPLVNEFVEEVIRSNLRPRLVIPETLQFSLNGAAIETPAQQSMPITDIIIINLDTSKPPKGYTLLERTASGLLAANINAGNNGKRLFLCYTRNPVGNPVTGLAIIYPKYNEAPPNDFELIEETIGGESANLNSGNSGQECYLCVSYAPGKPITGLVLCNEEEDYILFNDYKKLDLSVSGFNANLNGEGNGDPLYLAYRGGSGSCFGHSKEYTANKQSGLLRVDLVEASDVKIADIGGSSDPFCDIIVGNPSGKTKPSKKTSSVIFKTLTPKWNESFIYRNVSQQDILVINLYDKDEYLTNDFLGRIQIRLDTLVFGAEVEGWFTLELTTSGKIFVKVTALDFGLAPGTPVAPLITMKCDENSPLISDNNDFGIKAVDFVGGAIGSVGGGVVNAVGTVGGVGVKAVTTVGGAGVKAVTTVGGAGVKAVGTVGGAGVKAVGTVGGAGVKAVTTVGGGVVNAVGTVGGGAVNAVGTVGGGVVNAVGTVGGGVVNAVGTVGGGVVGLFKKKKHDDSESEESSSKKEKKEKKEKKDKEHNSEASESSEKHKGFNPVHSVGNAVENVGGAGVKAVGAVGDAVGDALGSVLPFGKKNKEKKEKEKQKKEQEKKDKENESSESKESKEEEKHSEKEPQKGFNPVHSVGNAVENVGGAGVKAVGAVGDAVGDALGSVLPFGKKNKEKKEKEKQKKEQEKKDKENEKKEKENESSESKESKEEEKHSEKEPEKQKGFNPVHSVGNAVENVGGAGVKAVGAVGGAVGDAIGSVLPFGKKKSKENKEKKEKEKKEKEQNERDLAKSNSESHSTAADNSSEATVETIVIPSDPTPVKEAAAAESKDKAKKEKKDKGKPFNPVSSVGNVVDGVGGAVGGLFGSGKNKIKKGLSLSSKEVKEKAAAKEPEIASKATETPSTNGDIKEEVRDVTLNAPIPTIHISSETLIESTDAPIEPKELSASKKKEKRRSGIFSSSTAGEEGSKGVTGAVGDALNTTTSAVGDAFSSTTNAVGNFLKVGRKKSHTGEKKKRKSHSNEHTEDNEKSESEGEGKKHKKRHHHHHKEHAEEASLNEEEVSESTPDKKKSKKSKKPTSLAIPSSDHSIDDEVKPPSPKHKENKVGGKIKKLFGGSKDKESKK